jgi:hypothetical protein
MPYDFHKTLIKQHTMIKHHRFNVVWRENYTTTFRTKSRKIALATMFGVVIFISKVALPYPFDKVLVALQALFLVLGALLMGRMGATYVSLVGGILMAFWRAATAPFTFAFAVIYGLLVDGLILGFKAKSVKGDVKTSRMVAAVTVSTGITGLTSYYVTVFVTQIIPRSLIVVYVAGFAINVVETGILIAGLINGLIAGYVATYIWKRNLQQLTTA